MSKIIYYSTTLLHTSVIINNRCLKLESQNKMMNIYSVFDIVLKMVEVFRQNVVPYRQLLKTTND